MNVADVQQHFVSLARLIESSGGKAAKELVQVADCLAPFGSQSLPDFTRFLALAHEYHTTGTLAAAAKPARQPRATKTKADPAEVAAAVRAIYDRAADLSLSMDQIETELAKMNGLQKAGLLVVCEAMELGGLKNKKVDEIRAAIGQKIKDRRGAAQRADMIQNPT